MNIVQSPANSHETFEWLRSQPIPSLNLVVEEYRHRRTGAMHLHIAADHDENVFMVALRTVPEDSTGVAHILEHTALCGSEKYPVRDPFFMMTRRSLNTFMNAFTSSDWTAYPFASQNRKDFDNLLEVYLDAVFFSRLDPLDFAQEGHRLEFSEPENPQSALEYKGVVFNEMKGAMSSITSTLWHTLCSYLFPSTTYHFNSGGDPEHIPDLSYEQLQSFYRSHYHPSNAIFMTFGNIDAADHQARFDSRALRRFEALDVNIAVPDEKRYHAPLRVEEYYAFEEEGDINGRTHVVLGWLLGHSTNLEDLLQAHLLSGVLLDNSSSPLQFALETSSLGNAPSPLCGLEDSNRELIFVCGLEGSEAHHADAVEKLVLDTLVTIVDQGVPQAHVESVLHQLELQQREIGGDGFPFGLQILMTALGSATHRSDPVALLDLDPVLEDLRRRIQDPDYIRGLARRLLLENNHRVRLVLRPDTKLAERRRAAEAAKLAKINDGLDEHQRQHIIATARDLKARQARADDPDCLPCVTRADIGPGQQEIASRPIDGLACPATLFERGTNGIVYQQIIIDMPELPDELLELLPYYSNALTEVGVGAHDYLETQARQAAVTGGLSAYSSMRGGIADEQQTRAFLTISSRSLARNAGAMSTLLRETIDQVRFDEYDRLRELVQQMRARRDQSITGHGHSLAMSAAESGMSPSAFLSNRLSGLQGIRFTRSLETSLRDEGALRSFAARLQALHELLRQAPCHLLLIADPDNADAVVAVQQQDWQDLVSAGEANAGFPAVRERRVQVWQTSTQVNFCAMACPTVPVEHDDAAALTVLGPFLRNGFLHRAIREQGGAYGGGASQDNANASFRFYSYRDPRRADTLADFAAAVDWMASHQHQERQVEEAMLGVIGSLDKPGSPAGEAKQQFHNAMHGRTVAQRRRFRQRIIDVTLEDLRRVAQTYLDPARASYAVVTNQEGARELASCATLAGHELLTLG